MCDRDAGKRGRGNGARDAGDDVAAHTGSRQRQGLLAAASQHKRVAALQPHDTAAAARGANHERVDSVLRQGMSSGALADEEPLRVPRVPENPLVDERVVKNKIGGSQTGDRFSGQKRGIAGAGPDERHLTLGRPEGPQF